MELTTRWRAKLVCHAQVIAILFQVCLDVMMNVHYQDPISMDKFVFRALRFSTRTLSNVKIAVQGLNLMYKKESACKRATRLSKGSSAIKARHSTLKMGNA